MEEVNYGIMQILKRNHQIRGGEMQSLGPLHAKQEDWKLFVL